jgi:molybdate transport system regulatory protein
MTEKEQSMNISVRNQLVATITALEKGAVNTMVTLKMPGGSQLASIITNEAVAGLQLETGEMVKAFFKASHVLLATGAVPNISARNKLEGTARKVTKGAVNAEVNILLPDGDVVTSIVTNEAINALGIKEGDSVVAVIKATDVMIAK